MCWFSKIKNVFCDGVARWCCFVFRVFCGWVAQCLPAFWSAAGCFWRRFGAPCLVIFETILSSGSSILTILGVWRVPGEASGPHLESESKKSAENQKMEAKIAPNWDLLEVILGALGCLRESFVWFWAVREGGGKQSKLNMHFRVSPGGPEFRTTPPSDTRQSESWPPTRRARSILLL